MSRKTIASIDLSAIAHNLEQVRRLAPDSQVISVVKADAYGHGLELVMPALTNSDLFAVATIGEARRLRLSGWKGRLLLLEGVSSENEYQEAIYLDLDMVVHQDHQVALIRTADKLPPCVWLKIDTGMHRLGFAAELASAAYQALRQRMDADKVVLMSHFACADEPDKDMTRDQIQRFDQTVRQMPGQQTLANSAGILNFPESHRDYVRPGVMLYGISPCEQHRSADFDLKPVMTLSCELIAINQCKAGDSVGYGANYRCPENMPVGVAAIGYGDGYPRHARNGTPVLVNGRRSTLVGRVSMDMITVDLRGHEGAKVGDKVVLWGEGLPIEEVAPWADAIPYQLVCGVTARVHYQISGQ